jgi:hypothetical protein
MNGTGSIKGHNWMSPYFRCGHPKGEGNEQRSGDSAPRCLTCYRERMRLYMRAHYRTKQSA